MITHPGTLRIYESHLITKRYDGLGIEPLRCIKVTERNGSSEFSICFHPEDIQMMFEKMSEWQDVGENQFVESIVL